MTADRDATTPPDPRAAIADALWNGVSRAATGYRMTTWGSVESSADNVLRALTAAGYVVVSGEGLHHGDQLELAGRLMCTNGRFVSAGHPDHAGLCPDCVPVWRKAAP